MGKDVRTHGDAPEQVIGLPRPTPAGFNLSIEVVEELLRLARDAIGLPVTLANDLLQYRQADVIASRCLLPVADEGELTTSDRDNVSLSR